MSKSKSKSVSVVKTIEEKALECFNDHEFLNKTPVPEGRTFEIGESVVIGNLNNCIVKGIHFNNKVLEVEYGGHGRDVPQGTRWTACWFWVDVFHNNKAPIKRIDVYTLNFSQRDLSSVFNCWAKFGIDLCPYYQRESVWTLEDRQDLIESIFNHVDIGKFVLVRLPYKDNSPSYEILDGKQRLETIISFFTDGFETKDGFKFSQLSKPDRDYLESYSISWAEFAPPNEKAKLDQFIRLNTCGKVISQDHIEKVKKQFENAKEN